MKRVNLGALYEVRINGIPAIVDVRHEEGDQGDFYNPPVEEYYEVRHVFDRKGYPAPFLQARLALDNDPYGALEHDVSEQIKDGRAEPVHPSAIHIKPK